MKRPYRIAKATDLKVIIQLNSTHTDQEIADILGLTYNQVIGLRRRSRVKKPDGFDARIGRERGGRNLKGAAPPVNNFCIIV